MRIGSPSRARRRRKTTHAIIPVVDLGCLHVSSLTDTQATSDHPLFGKLWPMNQCTIVHMTTVDEACPWGEASSAAVRLQLCGPQIKGRLGGVQKTRTPTACGQKIKKGGWKGGFGDPPQPPAPPVCLIRTGSDACGCATVRKLGVSRCPSRRLDRDTELVQRLSNRLIVLTLAIITRFLLTRPDTRAGSSHLPSRSLHNHHLPEREGEGEGEG